MSWKWPTCHIQDLLSRSRLDLDDAHIGSTLGGRHRGESGETSQGPAEPNRAPHHLQSE
jgi:hypothetical protein